MRRRAGGRLVRPDSPVVSVCIPTHNGAPWIRATLASALAQTEPDLEVLVADDASTDGTADLARATGDARVRVVAGERRRGLVGNWNRCLRLSRGRFVKFLFQDDLLRPDCVARMLALFADERVGLVFSRRDILVEDPADAWSREWLGWCGAPHRRLGYAPGRNAGRDVFDRWMSDRSWDSNWLGEPTCVMLRRDLLARIGGFNHRLVQTPDVEMWLRAAFHADVGFVDEALATFRLHGRSTTRGNVRAGRHWLDPVWLLEGLLRDPAIRAARPDLAARRRRAIERQAKRRVRHADGARRPAVWQGLRRAREWLGYRALLAVGRAAPLHAWKP